MTTANTPNTSARDELRRLYEEIELKVHLANMDARDQWTVLKRRIAALENDLSAASERASDRVGKELTAIGAALKAFRDEVFTKH